MAEKQNLTEAMKPFTALQGNDLARLKGELKRSTIEKRREELNHADLPEDVRHRLKQGRY
ncbi:hypothetical protein [Staphylococcus simulans]|uniref:hypothetical protein n=1 Tax=Staphylococcus simulans TaxID=1286 RepID=UPI000D1E048E|nr:hypothetical protein [Staphylococcus simulans]PTJ89328.1 hypothetical protein BU032_12355 [Staphylococcus simulans]